MEILSFWEKTSKIEEFSSLDRNIQVNTAIIGGGMAGILTAYFLKRRGIDCVVIEEKRVASGQTGNTTAKITSQHGCIYDKMIHNQGRVKAQQYVSANENAIWQYKKIVNELNIECGWKETKACLYTKDQPEMLERECKAARSLGIKAYIEGKTELPFPVESALYFENQASFHPLLFMKGLLDGLTIYENTKVIKVKEDLLLTDKGNIRAKHIVFACHYPFVNVPGYYFTKMHQERSYVVAVKGAVELQNMYISIDENPLSFRSYGDITLVGGGGHRTGENVQGGQYKRLKRAAAKYWSGAEEIGCWSAQDCITIDTIPYIGRFSKSRENWYIATGFGKWGMTSSMVSAMIISDMISGNENANAEVFSPQREKKNALTALANESGHAVRGLLGVSEKKEKGKRCPHMGCSLTWNPDENSYDCPCHGSRFDINGKKIDGPAQRGLCEREEN